MPFYQFLSILHAALLIWLSWKLSRRLFEGSFTAVLAAGVFAWTNLVLTSHMTSWVGLLGNPFAYLLVSVAVGLGLLHLSAKLELGPPAVDGVSCGDFLRSIRMDWVSILLLGLTGVTILLVLILAFAALPNNWDTLAYRFPRAFFYLSSGTLESPMRTGDVRIIFYPYNATLLYVFLAQYQLPAILWNLVTFAAWLGSGLSACVLVLFLGGTARAALSSTFLLMSTPIVLCLANSTNDELLAGAPLLVGTVFLILWYQVRSAGALYTALLILALGAASKLHWISLLLHFAVYGIVAFAKYRVELIALVRETVRKKALVSISVLLAPILLGFLVTNYIGQKRLFDSEYQNGIINLPFNTESATQTLYLYSAQLFVTPVLDHALLMGRETAGKVFKDANDSTNKSWFRNVKQGAPYTHQYYTFRGLYPPYALEYYEQSLWLGLVPYLVLIGVIWLVVERPTTRPMAWMLLLALPLWHINFSALNRYLETASTYYAYVAPLALASCGLLWDEWRQSNKTLWKLAAWIFPVVLVSNTLMGGVLLFASNKRTVSLAWTSRDGVTAVSHVDQTVKNVVQKANRVYIPYMHWELMFWNIMRLNPAARYYTGDYKTDLNYDLIVFPFDGNTTWGSLLPVRAPGLGEIRHMGSMGNGHSVLTCSGPLCQTECPECEEYFSYPIRHERKAGQLEVFATGAPVHIRLDKTGFVRISAANQAQRQYASSAWVPISELKSFRQSFPDQGYDHLILEVSCSAGPECRQAVTVVPLKNDRHYLLGPQLWLDPSLTQEVVDSVFGPKWVGTEGDGYWTFEWKLRPGTRVLDAQFHGKQGETVSDQLEVIYVDGKRVALQRKASNQIYHARWLSAQPQIAKGTTSTDPTNIWTGRRVVGTAAATGVPTKDAGK